MGVTKEIPIHLKDTKYEVTYEGPRENETRTIIWTLNFTVKGFVYGPVSEPKIIKRSITNIYDSTLSDSDLVEFDVDAGGLGDYQEGEFVYQGYTMDGATAVAKVIAWNSTTLKLQVGALTGNFVTSKPIYGKQTGAVYTIQAHQILPIHLVKIVATPNPLSANANSNYLYNTAVTEFPYADRETPSLDSNNMSIDDLDLTMDQDD
jgi:hypothetical protein